MGLGESEVSEAFSATILNWVKAVDEFNKIRKIEREEISC
jgi:hypothetical protein